MTNFISVVARHAYVHPPTTMLGDTEATREQVESSFRALHPEWDEQTGWLDQEGVARKLKNAPSRYQFEHGSRLFGVFGRAGAQLSHLSSREQLQPLPAAIHAVQRGSKTRAYVGLYNAELDLGSHEQPLPGLMAVQFVPDGNFLDCVATFRKLELSYWWSVNMLEMDRLLLWAVKSIGSQYSPRRVTFFAAVAEWKHNPEAAFILGLDAMELNQVIRIVNSSATGDASARQNLRDLLLEKAERSNDRNIDDTGLGNLAEAITASDWPESDAQFVENIRSALAHTRSAIHGGDDSRPLQLQEANNRLLAAINRLGDLVA